MTDAVWPFAEIGTIPDFRCGQDAKNLTVALRVQTADVKIL